MPSCLSRCCKKGKPKETGPSCACCAVQTAVPIPPPPPKTLVQPLLTDLYQVKMAYAYWKSGKAYDRSVFDLFFRRNPFQGEFAVFAGLHDCLKFLEAYSFSDDDLSYLRRTLPATVEDDFYATLSALTAKDVTLYAIKEGTVVFPRVPLIRVEGPLMVAQLLETTLLNLVNYASLVTTNAARYRILAGGGVELVEFGLRRAQGPKGGLLASKYSYVGGFDATSNVLAGKTYGIPLRGGHANSFVMAFGGVGGGEVKLKAKNGGAPGDLSQGAKVWRQKLIALLKTSPGPHDGELAAFVSFAVAFPEDFLVLVDTYDVASSGLINFCAVALALNDLGYNPVGVVIENGKLTCLSKMARRYFEEIGREYGVPWFARLKITVSNEVNEEMLAQLRGEPHEIDSFGVGAQHLVTCQKQGCVYKLVELGGEPKVKFGQKKFALPGRKSAHRIYNAQGKAIADLIQKHGEAPPSADGKILCRDPYDPTKCSYVVPGRVENLHAPVWRDGKILGAPPDLGEIKNELVNSLKSVGEEVKATSDPVPYQVAVSGAYYDFLQEFWAKNAPVVDFP